MEKTQLEIQRNAMNEEIGALAEICMNLREANVKLPDRDLALALTYAENSLMRLNRYYFQTRNKK